MAIAFKNSKGAAIKNSADAYKYVDGINKVRIFGDILPKYVYWVKGTNNKDIPLECLSFDREQERFTNVETDHVREAFPDLKCSWAYSVSCIDPTDGKAKVLNLKKGLFEEIITAADDLGDPTDLDNGWDLVFTKTKTGPLAFNVKYSLNVLKCKARPVTDEERATIEKAKSIDELIPRPKAADILASITRIKAGAPAEEEAAESQDASTREAIADLT